METHSTPHTPASLRTVLGKSQQEIADAAGVSVRTIRNLEEGDDVSLDSLRGIAPVLEVSFDALIAAIDTARARRAAGAA